MSEPVAKREGQRDKILLWLQMRGTRGVLNTELNEICLRYGARLHELRQAGHNIRTDRLDDSRYRFVLSDTDACRTVEATGHATVREPQSNSVATSVPVAQRAAEQQRLFA